MRMIATTQVYENYGAHDWNGEGECPQYWKPKFGSDYVVAEWPDVDFDLVNPGEIQELELLAIDEVERSDDYFTESVIGFYFVKEGEFTQDEVMNREQAEYFDREPGPQDEAPKLKMFRSTELV